MENLNNMKKTFTNNLIIMNINIKNLLFKIYFSIVTHKIKKNFKN